MNRIEIFRESTKKVVAMLSEKKVAVTQRGATAYVRYDERTGLPVQVNIPFIPDTASDELLTAIQGFIDHEVAHIFFTDPSCMGLAKGKKVKSFLNMIEDSRIEKLMAEKFAGSGLNLRNVGEFFLKNITDKHLAEFPDKPFNALIVPAIRAWAGQTVFIDYMQDKWPMIQSTVDALGDSVNDIAKCKSTKDALVLAERFVKLLSAPPEDGEGDGEGSGKKNKGEKGESGKTDKKSKKNSKSDSEHSEEIDDADSEGGEDGEKSESHDDDSDEGDKSDKEEDREESEEGDSDSGKGDSGDTEDEKSDGGTEDSGDEEGDDGSDKADSSETGDGKDSSSSSLEEQLESLDDEKIDFDKAVAQALTEISEEAISGSEYRIYSKDDDLIEPLPKRDDAHIIQKMMSSVDHMVGPLQKDLERAIAAKSKSAWSPGHRSGRLNPNALSRLVAFNDTRVFRRKQISNSKDVAVSLLVDMSGSMSNSNKMVIAADAAYALSSVLERLSVTHEILGFTTRGSITVASEDRNKIYEQSYARYDRLYIPIVKAFGDRLTPETMQRFAMLRHPLGIMSQNVDGESVEIAASRLSKRKETRKILIVLSDGLPACNGDRDQLRSHLKGVVKNVEGSGIDVLGIGIMSHAVKNFYSKHVVLESVDKLPGSVIKEIKTLLMKD